MSAITIERGRGRVPGPAWSFGLALLALTASLAALALAVVGQHRPMRPAATASPPAPHFQTSPMPPLVFGMTVAQATARLESAGYLVKVHRVHDYTDPAGRVVAETIASGAGPRTTVTLTVPIGPGSGRH